MTLRSWSLVHKWTSLVCTLFLLLLCVTGLPLIFHHEIDDWLEGGAEPVTPAPGSAAATLDAIVAAAQLRHPGDKVQFVIWDADDPRKVSVNLGPTLLAQDNTHLVTLDRHTAQVLHDGRNDEGVMHFIFTLHVDMFAGLPGKLFLGVMGMLFAVAVVSGVVLYAPFMRRLDFGTVRRQRSSRLKWLDLHNLLGVVTLSWAMVVGITGVINTWADLVIKLWQFDQLNAMVAPYKGQPPLAHLGPLHAAVDTARAAVPDMTPSFVAFPGTLFSSEHHYAVFMKGTTPLTARLLKPALIDAQTATLTDTRDMPWYVTSLLVSQPLHFGDYGGLPLKIIWALLDLVTIVVLGSGLYLWLVRRKRVTPVDDPEWRDAMSVVEAGTKP